MLALGLKKNRSGFDEPKRENNFSFRFRVAGVYPVHEAGSPRLGSSIHPIIPGNLTRVARVARVTFRPDGFLNRKTALRHTVAGTCGARLRAMLRLGHAGTDLPTGQQARDNASTFDVLMGVAVFPFLSAFWEDPASIFCPRKSEAVGGWGCLSFRFLSFPFYSLQRKRTA